MTMMKELNMPSMKAKTTIVNRVESSINIDSSFSVDSKQWAVYSRRWEGDCLL